MNLRNKPVAILIADQKIWKQNKSRVGIYSSNQKIYQEVIAILKIYEPNTRVPIKETLLYWKSYTSLHTVIESDYSTDSNW